MKLKTIVSLLFFCFGSTLTEAQTIQMTTDTFSIDGPNGRLHAILTTPETPAQTKIPITIIMHGLMSNSEEHLIQTMAEKLNNSGMATLRFDVNGHGKNDGEYIKMTVPKEIEEAKAVISYIENTDRLSTISLVGHSQGGVVTSMVAGESAPGEIDRIVLFAPGAVIYDEDNAGTTLFTKYDPDNVPEYITTFNHNIGRDWILEAQKLQIYPTAEKFKGAVCIIHGIPDELVPYTYAQKYHDRYANSELHLLENTDHAFSQDIDGVTTIAFDFLTSKK